MKISNLLKTAMPGALVALLAVQTARAQYNPNDLILGFNRGGGFGPNDYIIDLGNANSAVGVGGPSVVDLSGLFSSSLFNSTYSQLAGVSMSVVGGNGATAGRDLYLTALRTSNFGIGNISGSSAPLSLSSSPMGGGANDVASMINGLGLTASGHTTVSQGDPNSFFNNILSTTPPSLRADTGRDPSGSVASGTLIYEDLYRGVPNGAFTYTGFFTLDTGSGSLTFTPLAVPEPSSLSIFVVGMLVLLLICRIKTRTA